MKPTQNIFVSNRIFFDSIISGTIESFILGIGSSYLRHPPKLISLIILPSKSKISPNLNGQ